MSKLILKKNIIVELGYKYWTYKYWSSDFWEGGNYLLTRMEISGWRVHLHTI